MEPLHVDLQTLLTDARDVADLAFPLHVLAYTVVLIQGLLVREPLVVAIVAVELVWLVL